MKPQKLRVRTTLNGLLCLIAATAIFWDLVSVTAEAERCPNTAPSLEKRRLINKALARVKSDYPQKRSPGSVTIRVYFNILMSNDGQGDVSDEAIRYQIQVLNRAFAGAGGAGAASTPFKFVWAGTHREKNDAWFNMRYNENPTAEERAAKKKLNQGGKGALNIYTANVAGTLVGWGRFPWDLKLGVDGVVVRYSTLPGGSEYPYNEGDTATHEVGHWLGLYHTYEGNCEPPGDEIEDTPPGKDKATGCPNDFNSCPDKPYYDAVHNFMNATTDKCMWEFTRRQSERMDFMHRTFRT